MVMGRNAPSVNRQNTASCWQPVRACFRRLDSSRGGRDLADHAETTHPGIPRLSSTADQGPRMGQTTIHLLIPAGAGKATRYGGFGPPIELGGLPTYLPKGGIAGIRPGPDSSWTETASHARRVARRLVNAPIALWLSGDGGSLEDQLVLRAGLAGVDLVVRVPDPPVEMLRAALTDPFAWPARVVRWRGRRAGRLPPDARDLLDRLAPHHRTVREIVGDESAVRQWSRTFARSGLGPVGRWHAALRTTFIVMALQRRPDLTVAEVAHGFGLTARSITVSGGGLWERVPVLGSAWKRCADRSIHLLATPREPIICYSAGIKRRDLAPPRN
jgi:hypothetical protein